MVLNQCFKRHSGINNSWTSNMFKDFQAWDKWKLKELKYLKFKVFFKINVNLGISWVKQNNTKENNLKWKKCFIIILSANPHFFSSFVALIWKIEKIYNQQWLSSSHHCNRCASYDHCYICILGSWYSFPIAKRIDIILPQNTIFVCICHLNFLRMYSSIILQLQWLLLFYEYN